MNGLAGCSLKAVVSVDSYHQLLQFPSSSKTTQMTHKTPLHAAPLWLLPPVSNTQKQVRAHSFSCERCNRASTTSKVAGSPSMKNPCEFLEHDRPRLKLITTHIMSVLHVSRPNSPAQSLQNRCRSGTGHLSRISCPVSGKMSHHQKWEA